MSREELDALRTLIARDLADASITGLSPDRRFATAYNAALQAANMAIACAGYRVTAKSGHHRIAIAGMELTLGPRAKRYAEYFETCRRKRNLIDYTRSSVATESEAAEMVRKAREFHRFVERWIASQFPDLQC